MQYSDIHLIRTQLLFLCIVAPVNCYFWRNGTTKSSATDCQVYMSGWARLPLIILRMTGRSVAVCKLILMSDTINKNFTCIFHSRDCFLDHHHITVAWEAMGWLHTRR